MNILCLKNFPVSVALNPRPFNLGLHCLNFFRLLGTCVAAVQQPISATHLFNLIYVGSSTQADWPFIKMQ